MGREGNGKEGLIPDGSACGSPAKGAAGSGQEPPYEGLDSLGWKRAAGAKYDYAILDVARLPGEMETDAGKAVLISASGTAGCTVRIEGRSGPVTGICCGLYLAGHLACLTEDAPPGASRRRTGARLTMNDGSEGCIIDMEPGSYLAAMQFGLWSERYVLLLKGAYVGSFFKKRLGAELRKAWLPEPGPADAAGQDGTCAPDGIPGMGGGDAHASPAAGETGADGKQEAAEAEAGAPAADKETGMTAAARMRRALSAQREAERKARLLAETDTAAGRPTAVQEAGNAQMPPVPAAGDPGDIVIDFGPFRPNPRPTRLKPGPMRLSQVIALRPEFIESLIGSRPPAYARMIPDILGYCSSHGIRLHARNETAAGMLRMYGVEEASAPAGQEQEAASEETGPCAAMAEAAAQAEDPGPQEGTPGSAPDEAATGGPEGTGPDAGRLMTRLMNVLRQEPGDKGPEAVQDAIRLVIGWYEEAGYGSRAGLAAAGMETMLDLLMQDGSQPAA